MTRRTFLLPLFALAAFSATSSAEQSILQRGRTHWAFHPVTTPAVPRVQQPAWVRTPIDAFILARLEAEKLTPAPPADRRTLLRRLSLDLIGLPPSPEEQRAFIADSSPDAYERLVQRLLASPAYGERWARHWLDVARYADTNGYERDGNKPNAWRYRDYVVDAFNRDLPFDQFTREQIAGDEVPGSDARTQIATTFLRLGTWDDEPANDTVDRYDQLDDVLGVTATAFLAQTIRCARCHDHKFEPFSQKDYYRLLAIFEPLKRPQRGRSDLDRPVGNAQELAVYHGAKARYEAALAALESRAAVLGDSIGKRLLAGTKISDEVRRALLTPLKRRTTQQQQIIDREVLAGATKEEKPRLEAFARQRQAIEAGRPAELPRAYVWSEAGPKAPVTRLFRRGNPSMARGEVQPGLPTILAPVPPPPPKPLSKSTGRRLWLANWIASTDNPLTARVIVNRVWQWHFGRGLAATPSDFGLMGEVPSHPELLDWLANEFVRHNWSLKHLHRLILLSSTYRASSAYEGPAAARKLNLFGRWQQRRLEAEVIRDSMLAVSGTLNRQAGGPGVYPPLPPAVLAGQSRPGNGWGRSDERQSFRRSIYVFAKRTLALPELELLDTPDTTSSCEQRPRSTTAPQALTFLNGAFTHKQASHFTDRLMQEAGNDQARQIELSFLLALCRPPSESEMNKSLAFLERQAKQIESEKPGRNSRRDALMSFCLVLFNSNEFFYPG